MTKIMLVEDDKSLSEIYSIRLVAEGYSVVSAGDGEEALAMAVRERPDLIISDVMMPKISGFDMLDIIRSTPETKDIKVIMMTALSSEDQRKRGENLGADRYLVKSQVGIEDVVNAVHEVLGDQPTTHGADNIKTAASIISSTAPAVPPPPTPTPAPAPSVPNPSPAPAPSPAPTAPAATQPAPVNPPVAQQASPQSPAPTPAPAAPTPPLAAPRPVSIPVAAPAPTPAPASVPPAIPTQPPAPQPTPIQPAAAPAVSAQSPVPQAAPVPTPPPAPAGGERVIQPLNPVVHDANNGRDPAMEARMAEALGESNAPASQ